MKGTFDGSDIDLYLTEEEFKFLGMIKIVEIDGKFKIVYESLECRLQKMDGSDSGRKAHLQREDFEELGDGIKVNYREGTYFIKFNDHAADLIEERGRFGTRYGMGDKITIYISERCKIPL